MRMVCVPWYEGPCPWEWSVLHGMRVHVREEGLHSMVCRESLYSMVLGSMFHGFAVVGATGLVALWQWLLYDVALPWWMGQELFVLHGLWSLVVWQDSGHNGWKLLDAPRREEERNEEELPPAGAASCSALGSSEPSWAEPVPQGLNPIPV